MVRMLIEQPNELAIILFAENEGKEVVGVIAAQVTTAHIGLEPMALEFLWWVHPVFRKTRLSIELVNGFEYWCKKVGVRHCILSNMDNEHSASVEKFYKKKGYIKAETTFVKELN